jgi:hypothetical protein
MTDLPAYCLRGLRKADWVIDQAVIATEAFIPDPRTAKTRSDGGKETSINWEDTAEVEKFTFADKQNAQHGLARLATAAILHISRTVPGITMPLNCERQPLPKNDYHGNIVYSAKVNPKVEKMLAAALALKGQFVPPSLEPIQ